MPENNSFQPLLSAVSFFQSFPCDWFVCGGWAIDLFLDHCTRNHQDVEIGIWRQDQKSLHESLKEWDKHYINTGQKVSWNEYKELFLPLHEIHAEKNGIIIEVLLNESKVSRWTYRRDLRIFHATPIYYHAKLNLPYLAPEICLLYKSKHLRDKDLTDFQNVYPHLSEKSRHWLAESLTLSDPQHAWLKAL